MGLFGKKEKKQIDWIALKNIEELTAAYLDSENQPGLFFKHSTRCSISSMALSRFEREWDNENQCKLYFIDLIAYRDVSNELATISGIEHQSPQAILIHNKKSIYNSSHSGISAADIKNLL